MRLEDAAAWLEVAPSTLSRIETGKAPTRVSYLVVLLITTTRTTEVRAMHDTFTALAQAAMTPANSERLIKNLTRRGVAA